MKFYSPNFDDFKPMPEIFTCDGQNCSPTFEISEVPEGTKELVLICHDPDATSGNDFTHWLVTGINPNTVDISDSNTPKGALTCLSDFGQASYGGPCPPAGSAPHRYIFSLYAVNFKSSFDKSSSRDVILRAISGNILAQSTWTGTYQRKDITT